MSDYLLDKEYTEAKNRLKIKENIQDPATLEYFDKIGIENGWKCLELGGGGGSIAAHLCEKAGAEGCVTVIDTETRFLVDLNFNNLKIIKADISGFDFGEEEYDFIHGRDIILHIKNRDEVLERLFTALKYNGWILLEEPDVSADKADPLSAENEKNLYKEVTDAFYLFLQNQGVDPYSGATILGRLRRLGFTSLSAEGRVQMFTGGNENLRTPHLMAFEQLKDDIIAAGNLKESDFDEFLKLFRNKDFAWKEGFTISVWGRKPRSNA